MIKKYPITFAATTEDVESLKFLSDMTGITRSTLCRAGLQAVICLGINFIKKYFSDKANLDLRIMHIIYQGLYRLYPEVVPPTYADIQDERLGLLPDETLSEAANEPDVRNRSDAERNRRFV